MNANRSILDVFIKIVVKLTGISTLFVLAGIFLMLLLNTIQFFGQYPLMDFLMGYTWGPDEKFGLLPILYSTLLVTVGAMLIAIPIGVLTAAFLSEFSPSWLQTLLKPIIEMLAAIPSVAIGFLGIVLLGPLITQVLGLPNGLNALNGSILLSIMSLPTLITISEDAIHAVPKSHREASYALGANKWQTLFKVTIPSAMPGLIAAIMLGFGRALGETMTVLMATGNASAMPTGFLSSIRTITATIAIEMGEVPYQQKHYFGLFAIAFVLFLLSLMVNITGEYFANKIRKFQ